jgi:hypothetical protein
MAWLVSESLQLAYDSFRLQHTGFQAVIHEAGTEFVVTLPKKR